MHLQQQLCLSFTCFSQEYNRTGAEIALNWVHKHDVSIVARSTKKSHLKQNLRVFSWELDQETVEALDALDKPEGMPSFSCSDESGWTSP